MNLPDEWITIISDYAKSKNPIQNALALWIKSAADPDPYNEYAQGVVPDAWYCTNALKLNCVSGPRP
jgi:hypothetical protein